MNKTFEGMNAPLPSAEVIAASESRFGDVPLTASEADRSCKGPLLLMFYGATAWLVVGILCELVSTIKLHGPGFLVGSSWLTYGRLHPAALSALAYGFASQAAMALALWMMVRLSRVELPIAKLLLLAGGFWNVGVAAGFVGILAGENTGFEWLEMPGLAGPLMFVAYAVIGMSALMAFHGRHDREMYVSQWYLLAALLWFPWIFTTGQLLLVQWPVRGVVQEVVSGWYGHNFFMLWLTPVGLAALFYFIPKLLGRPLHSHYLAVFGFWTLALFGGWGEFHGGMPVPKWISSVSIAAGTLLLIPLISVALNWYHTIAEGGRVAREDWVFRYMRFAAMSFVVGELLRIAGLQRTVGKVTALSYARLGVTELFFFGFMMMIMAGAMFYLVPRLTGAGWGSYRLVQRYFRASVAGTVLASLSLIFGGLIQGAALNDASVDFMKVTARIVPFVGLNTVGLLILLGANVGLLVSFSRHLKSACCCCMPAGEARGRAGGVRS